MHLPSEIEGTRLEFPALDGFTLGARRYEPIGPARGTVVIHGATAVPQRFYAPLAGFLAARSLRVLTYDYRGIGDSRPASLRKLVADYDDWAKLDARAVHRFAKKLGGPVAAIGHSFGGHLIGLFDELRELSGMALVACQLPYYRDWPSALGRARMALTWRVLLPTLTRAFGYLPGAAGLGTDLPAGVARQWARWSMSPEYLLVDHPEARARFARFDRPTLLYSFSDDPYAPLPSVERLVDALRSPLLTHLRLEPDQVGPMGHFGFFRRKQGAPLWPGLLDFLEHVLDGESATVTAPQPWTPPTLEEVMQDLSYGR
jgi:predicted alpha/beta hydrolase